MVEELTYKFGFEKLNVWQNAIQFVKKIYLIAEIFPKDEVYGLTSQLKRAVISIPSNIAEGSTRKTMKEQARYTEIAFGSLIEALNQLIIAKELKYIDDEQLSTLRQEIEIISRQLNALKNSQMERQNDK